ncbi:hypothetical protein WA026_016751 [Henosepilachna vigintioctopunctata]|uniref:FP protein C-terminal domain-containing protein n=1 Tax=Henosepilachna vigintioctopunctata TaxID=420089 RepID=A0AAW1UZD3_9CUCU
MIGLPAEDSSEVRNNVLCVLKKLENQAERDFECRILPGRNKNDFVNLIKFKKEGSSKELLKKKKIGILELLDCGIGNRKGSIYINEDISTDTKKKLFQKARKLHKHGFRLILCRDGQSLVRKSDFSNAIKMKCESQIIEMMAPAKPQE